MTDYHWNFIIFKCQKEIKKCLLEWANNFAEPTEKTALSERSEFAVFYGDAINCLVNGNRASFLFLFGITLPICVYSEADL